MMGVTVKATMGTSLYYTTIHTATNTLISDEPLSLGGLDKGFNPFELLASALASCTCATLRMYIDRKEWTVDEINVEVHFERDAETNTSSFKRIIDVKGILDETQRVRLLSIANACPVHKVLSNQNNIETIIS